MPNAVRVYVRVVDRVNRAIGRVVMYLVFVMIALQLYSSIARSILHAPIDWGMEMSQFILSGYYLLGGGYSLQLDSHVRMDLLYGRWSPRRRAVTDVITVLFLLFYLGVLLTGAISSTGYAIEYGQKNYTAWAPMLWPVKLVMTIGIALMVLQVVATLLRDIAAARGETLP